MRALVAGFGNIFFGDDAFGSVVARTLATQTLPANVSVADFGIRGIHVAFEMLSGYDLVVLVDAVKLDGDPGTLYVIEPHELPATAPDAHAMELHNALAFYARLAEQLDAPNLPKVLIVGCEPGNVGETMELSEPVTRAVPKAISLISSVLERNGIGAHLV
jgi:hydrogenase maturation protease